MPRWAGTLAAACLALLPVAAHGAPFTAGDLVINRSGNGSTTLSSAAFAVSVVELTTSGGNPSGGANIISLPNFGTANQGGLTDGGSSGTQGELTLSGNGQYLTLSGYDAPTGTTGITSSTPAADNRNVAQIDSNGNITIVARLTDAFSAGNTRAPMTDTGTGSGYYVVGNQDLRWVNTTSGVPTTSTSIYSTQNLENAQFATDSAWNKYLVFCSAKTSPWIAYFAAPFPTATATPTSVFTGSTLTAPTGFAVLDVDGNATTGGIGGLDTFYVADGTSVKKFVWSGSAWTAAGSFTATGTPTFDCVAARVVASNVEVYVTSAPASNNALFKYVDTSGYGNSISGGATAGASIASAGANYAFRGVAFVASPVLLASSGTPSALTTSQGVASSSTSFSVSAASGLTGNVTVTAPTGFQVSTSSGSGYANSITLAESGGALAATTVYVRLPSTDSVGTYSGNIVCSSAGSAALYVPLASSAVTGSVPTITLTGTPVALSSTYGSASSPTSFSASGANLTGNVTVTAPAGFQVSLASGSGYGSSVTLTQSGGSVSATTVYVELLGTDAVAASPYSGNVSASSAGAVTQTIAIPASTVSPLALTVSGVAVTTKPWDGTTAATITGTLVGVVSGDTVTLGGTGTFASASDGTGIAVTSTSTLSGASAGNYTLTQPTGLTGTILPSANLGNLTVGAGALSPAFAFNSNSYSETVSSTQTSLSLTPTTDSGATVTVNGAALSGPVSLVFGTNTFTIVVTNSSASPTTQTYTLTVTVPTPFTLGNLAFESIGNSTATPMTILEIDPTDSNQTPVNTYSVPSTGTSALRQSNAGTTARLGLTNDGTLLAFTGFEDSTGILSGAPVTDETAIALRGVATLDGSYDYTLQASYNVSAQATPLGDQIRTATSLDNTNWIMDDKVGIYKNNGNVAANAAYGNTTNCVVVKSFGGTIYALSQKTTGALSTLSSDGLTLTSLPGLTLDANAVDFQLIASGVHGSAFDLLYILDGTTFNKFSLVSGSWVQNGAATSIGGATGVGMCAASNGTGANFYVTTGTGLTVLEITDIAGYDTAPNINTANNVTLYTAPTGQFLKGVAFAPVSTPLPDVTIAVSGNSSPDVPGAPVLVSGGNPVTFYLTVANSGAASASNVSAVFTLPTGLTYSSATTPAGSFSQSGQVVTFNLGTLAANSTANLTVTTTTAPNGAYTVDAGPTPLLVGHGTAAVTTASTESNTANDSANVSALVQVGSVPYLNVSVSGPGTEALTTTGGVASASYAYTLTVQNIGTAALTGASVNFTLPAGATYVSSLDNGSAGFTGAYNTGVVTLSGGTIAAGGTETLTVNVSTSTSTYRIYTVDLPAGAVTVTGGNAAGNTTSTSTVATAVGLPSGPDLIVSSTPNGPFLAGDAADTYTVYVSNFGSNVTDGTTVTVTTTFPTGLTPTAAAGTGWTAGVNGQTVTATRSDVLSPGAIGVNQGVSTPVYPDYPVDVTTSYPPLTFTVSVASGTTGQALSNTVNVSGGGDAFPANGTAADTVSIGTPSALSTAGKLLVSRAHYTGTASTITVGEILPSGVLATVNGSYPNLWDNEAAEESFGITAPIYLDLINKTQASPIASSTLSSSPNLTSLITTQLGVPVTTSFSSKSELGVTLTPDSNGITFMGYLAPPNTLDVSNAETPYHFDPTSPLANHGNFQHVVVQMDYRGNFKATPIDAYSGDNTRAVILEPSSDGSSYYYIAGSSGNAGTGITGATMTMYAQDTGIQMIPPGAGGLTIPVGIPNGTPGSATGYQLGYAGLPTDKTGKDMNLRGLTFNPFNNTFYASKGSGGAGVDTIYQIGSGGAPTAANANTLSFTIPPGFPTTSSGYYPFGMWFANATTLYVGDEGLPTIPTPSQYSGGQYTPALPANNPKAGLQKWVYSGGSWSLAYTLQSGLNLGVPYSYAIANYPAPGTVNSATGVPYQPANNGLRGITGQVNGDGTVTIYAVTATISGETDEGADPNQIVAITDNLAAASLPSSESFTVLETADGPDALRGVALAPGPIVADLTVALASAADFTQGDSGDIYTLTVSNSGAASTSGTVTVAATLPPGLTATAMSGSGWTVNLGALTATRTDVLAVGASYPPLIVTVDVATNAAASVTTTATVSGGGEVYTADDAASEVTTILTVPVNSDAATNVTATGSTLNGNVDPNGVATSVYFQYGTSTAYGQTTGMLNLGSGTSAVPFDVNLTGLQASTTYYYRLVTVANGVTTPYAGQTFVTPIAPDTNALGSIQHIVVIYQENWTFDSLYGSYPGANGVSSTHNTSVPNFNTQIDRLTGAYLDTELGNTFVDVAWANGPSGSPTTLNPPLPLVYEAKNQAYDIAHFGPATGALNTLVPWDLQAASAAYTPFTPSTNPGDTYHRFWQEQYQIRGTTVSLQGSQQADGSYQTSSSNANDALATTGLSGTGFVTWCDDPGMTMAQINATSLPEGLLAQQYTLCDNYFHNVFGGSFLCHHFLIAGQPPVYADMPGYVNSSNKGNSANITYLDQNGVLVLNSTGTPGAGTYGVFVNDGWVAPVSGDVVPVTVNGTAKTVTLTAANSKPYSSAPSTVFTQHYALNTARSANLPNGTDAYPPGNGTSGTNAALLPSQNDSNPNETSYAGINGTAPRPFIPTIGDLLSSHNVSWKYYSGCWAMMAYYSPANNGNPNNGNKNTAYAANPLYSAAPGSAAQGSNGSYAYIGAGEANANYAAGAPLANTGYTGSYAADNSVFQFEYHHQPFAYYDNYAPFGNATVPSQYVGGFAGVLPSGVTAGASGISINQATNSAAHLQDELNFYADVASGNLPAVCFVKPVGVDNEHPGYANLQQGMAHTTALVQAVQNNPALWANTLIIITYDEHGGKWDHVTPPARDQWGPGERVPAVLISPLVRKGVVDHTQCDTSSILSTIEAVFLNGQTLNSLAAGGTDPNTTGTTLDADAPTFIHALASLQVTRSGFVVNRRTNSTSQAITITNNASTTVSGPIDLVVSGLSSNTSLESPTGTTVNNYVGSPYVLATSGSLAPGASVTVTLSFTTPSTGSISYSAYTVFGVANP